MNAGNFVSNLVQPDCSFPSLNNLPGHHTFILLVSDNCTPVDQVYFYNIVVVFLFHLSRGPLFSIIFGFFFMMRIKV